MSGIGLVATDTAQLTPLSELSQHLSCDTLAIRFATSHTRLRQSLSVIVREQLRYHCRKSFVPVIEFETHIDAPIEVVFDLSRSVDLHVKSTAHTIERAIAGCTSGLIGLGDEVTWEATHFGVRQQLTTRITQYDRPTHFRDSMVRGAFRRFDHDHIFECDKSGTIMRDRFDYTSPLGLLGRIADVLFLERYMARLLHVRNSLIKSVAESGEADKFVGGS